MDGSKRSPSTGYLKIEEIFHPYSEQDAIAISSDNSDLKLGMIFGFFRASFYYQDKDDVRTVYLNLLAPLCKSEIEMLSSRLDAVFGHKIKEFVIRQLPSDDAVSANKWLRLRHGDPDDPIERFIGEVYRFKSSHFGKNLIDGYLKKKDEEIAKVKKKAQEKLQEKGSRNRIPKETLISLETKMKRLLLDKFGLSDYGEFSFNKAFIEGKGSANQFKLVFEVYETDDSIEGFMNDEGIKSNFTNDQIDDIEFEFKRKTIF